MNSSSPRKQRKLLYTSPKHLRTKLLTAKVSDELSNQYGISRIKVRKGDTVKVLRGTNVGFEGKVNSVDTKSGFVMIEGLTRKKVDGTPVFVKIRASNLVVTKLDMSDPLRRKSIERKAEQRKLFMRSEAQNGS
ncbi:50S ribosomal protein L24 [Sulfodiicoccus acidiphilus]|uniref:Large ribosomal subunit protein uL24 n=1 Tax=Sulfodiicoccus acidiphilus TaxID=1670455 RepID=A0A348B153_9CREN|nr:50S ribosomal protein L24 [Sulfodiicoccus acidiphilus]BBD71905.1 50S ribosomal protein L24 [Sulfodiicoccus acidiphilus]GGT91346.1 50S ribosomal protein L24 [Sulfodiicoccus acidiphilus]